MRLKHLESALSSVQREFPNPNVALEQYPTSPHLAASVILHALERNDIGPGRTVLDLGCGTGMLALGSAMVESDHVFGVDCDRSALEIAQENVNDLELEDSISLIHGVVGKYALDDKKSKYIRKHRGSKGPFRSEARGEAVDPSPFPCRTNSVDTVVCNPPFGTKRAGIDIEFLHVACRSVYSFHKTSTREFVLRQARGTATVVAEMRFDIPKSYEFHKEKSVDIAVDLIRVDVSASSCS